MSSSSSSSSSSSASSSSGSIKHKRKREDIADSDSDTSDSESDSQSDTSSRINELTVIALEDDTPTLSHAAKRKQKKQARKQQKQLEDDTDSGVPKKKRKLKDGSAASQSQDTTNGINLKRQNSIWVGNMTFKTTEENLRTFFKDRGVGDITRVNMPTKAVKGPAAKGPGLRAENRGFAYVDFETPEAKQAAIQLSEQPLLGRKLLIKDGDDYSGRPNQPASETSVAANGVKKSLSKFAQKILRNQKQSPGPTLFFGNLSFDTTDDSLRELLEAHREKRKQKGKSTEVSSKEGEQTEELWIRKVRLGTFEDSGKCKGFGFVDFINTEFATSALVNSKNHHLNGRDLVVEYASAEAIRRGAPKGQKQKMQGDTKVPIERVERKPREKEMLPPPKTKTSLPVEETQDVKGLASPEAEITSHWLGRSNQPQTYHKRDTDGGRSRKRPKPGAALALAKRQSAAIVPSQGQKTTF